MMMLQSYAIQGLWNAENNFLSKQGLFETAQTSPDFRSHWLTYIWANRNLLLEKLAFQM